MKRVLALFLSYTLILTSVSPAFALEGPGGRAVGNVVRGAKTAVVVTDVSEHTAEVMARISQQLGNSSTQVARVARTSVPIVRSVAGESVDVDALLSYGWTERTQLAKINFQPLLLTPQQSAHILLSTDPSAISRLSTEQLSSLYLTGFPAVTVEGPLVLTTRQLVGAKVFYRNLILNTPAHSVGRNYFDNWAKIMAAVTNLGFLGSIQDADIVLEAAKKQYLGILTGLTDLTAVRALLNIRAYGKIQELANYRLSMVDGNSSPMQLPAQWRDIQQYMQESGFELEIPQHRIAAVYSQISPEIEGWLSYYNAYNLINMDASPAVTRDWLELRKGIEERAIMAGIQQGISIPEVPYVPTLTPRGVGELKISELNIPVGVLTSSDLSIPSTPLSEGTPAPTTASPLETPSVPEATTSVVPYTRPSIFKRIEDNWRSFTSRFRSKSANTNAETILNKPYPMLTQLRDIVFSDAAIHYKREALVRLYNRGVFKTFLETQPQAVRDQIELLSSDAARGRALMHLYEMKYLDPSLQAISDVLEQGSLLAELDEIISDADWSSKAELAYSYSKQLPFNEDSNFEGAVPIVPEADQEAIADTFRPEGFAMRNSAPGVVRPKGIFYENNIPFYYRYADSHLSSQPVGILSQVPASWYGRFLSSIGMASKPGFTVPQGFVLAIDEQGKWKFVMPRGNLSIVEGNKYSAKILKQLQKDGSYHVLLDTPYSSTDLLAMANMLEHKPGLNLELTLNTPHSLRQFLTAHAFFVGNDAGNTLTGPFKTSLKSMEGLANTMANGVSGIGYFTPLVGGVMMPTMSRWGNVRTTKFIYGTAAAALAYSVFGLGMYGTVDPTTLPLGALAIPTVALVLGASLANSFIPTFLNFYKDPAARTAANLDFSTKKQMSRMGLSLLTAGVIGVGGNWTVVAPVGLGLLGTSYLLFRNTPMYKEAKAQARQAAAEKPESEKLSFSEWYAQMKSKRTEQNNQKQKDAVFVQDYQNFARNTPEMQAIKNRVKMVYASYAASLMMMGQAANVAFPNFGQTYITLCMGATLGMRLLATRLVRRNIMTDDQLTGISLPTLALTGAALTLAPYSGPLALATGLAGILHYMATAVPGQLDAARMQNIVTAEMSRRKQAVLDDATLTEGEKEAKIEALTREEKVWSAQASKGYSYYNARGLWGVGAATAGAYLFADLGPQWATDVLTWISNVFGDGSKPGLALNRLIFGYSTTVASILAFKNRGLLGDFFNFFRRQKVTEEALEASQIHASNFGITEQNVELRLVDSNKEIRELEKLVVDFGYYSEQRMTYLFNRMIVLHNRLVAQAEILGLDRVRPSFEAFIEIAKTYDKILSHSDLSVMLQREFGKLQAHLYDPSTGQLVDNPAYVEEGAFGLPPEYDAYESASALLRELDQLAYTLTRGGVIDYKEFVNYVNRIREDLLRYEKANPADSPRIAALRNKMTHICETLYQADAERNLLAPDKKDTADVRAQKQMLRDVLAGYKK